MPRVTMILTDQDVANTVTIKEAAHAKGNTHAVSIALSLAVFCFDSLKKGDLFMRTPDGATSRIVMPLGEPASDPDHTLDDDWGPSTVVYSKTHFNAAKSTIHGLSFLVGAICLLFVLGGFSLLFWGSSTATTVSLLGARIETGSIGLVCLFFGAVMLGILVRYAFRAVTDTLKIPDPKPKPTSRSTSARASRVAIPKKGASES